MFRLSIRSVCVEIHSEIENELASSLVSDFARRYVPSMSIQGNCSSANALVYWLRGSGFNILSTSFLPSGLDVYVVEGEPPIAYLNESPIFFLLQVLARSLARTGYLLLTDSVAINTGSKVILLLGYPHTGKSTIAAIAASKGFSVLSTENTVVYADEKELRVLDGTRILVFDPKIRELFGVNIESTGKTRHGYEIVDLDLSQENRMLNSRNIVDEIYVVYTSFSCTGASLVPVKGRKVEKLLWHFATSLLKGVEYYYPQPIDTLLDKQITTVIKRFINTVREKYSTRFYEAFGSPLEVFRTIAEK